MKIFLSVVGFIALCVGAFALVAPMQLLTSKGAVASAVTVVWVREVGVNILALGVMPLLMRKHAASPTLRAFFIGNAVVQLGLLPIELLAWHDGTLSRLSGVVPNSVLHAVLGTTFAVLALREMPRQTNLQQPDRDRRISSRPFVTSGEPRRSHSMYVIAGVTGHVGSAAAHSLLAEKQKIRVLVRDPKKGEAWSKQGAEVAAGQLDDVAFLTSALKGATGFFTLLPPDMTPPDMFARQVQRSDAIAAAVKAANVPHVVMLSSIGADHDSGNGPIRGVNYLEKKLRETGAQVTIIRAGSFQENIANSVGSAKGMGVFFNMGASQDYPLPMIATKDIGALVAKSLLHPAAKTEIIDIHGPAYSVRDQATKLGAALGKELKIVDVPAAEHEKAFLQAGMPPHAAASYAEMMKFFGSGVAAPIGDRMVQGSTTLDEVIKGVVNGPASTH